MSRRDRPADPDPTDLAGRVFDAFELAGLQVDVRRVRPVPGGFRLVLRVSTGSDMALGGARIPTTSREETF
jgi:hypothetical protein